MTDSKPAAVTHETVIQNVHEIREEKITREIHNYDIYHRILPIIDIEVLPARHFVPGNGGYVEISEDEIPGRTKDKINWVVAETVSKMTPATAEHAGPRQFTARKFQGTDGDYKEYAAPEGHPVTETTWVHPPSYEDGGRRTGQTYPFYFGSQTPADDGLRAKLPEGEIIGMTPLLAQQRRAQSSSSQSASATVSRQTPGTWIDGAADQPPPVPPHRNVPAARETLH